MLSPRTIIADDHQLIVDGLRSILSGHVDLVAAVNDGEALLEATLRLRPALVISDIAMPKLSGLDVLRRLRAAGDATRFILLTMHDDATLAAESLRAGTSGYLLKYSAGEELIAAIEGVMQGRTYLSPLITKDVVTKFVSDTASPRSHGLTRRQREVLRLTAAGKSMKEIGVALRLSRRTVEMHKYEMMQTLGVKTTAELILYFVKHEELMTEHEVDTAPAGRRRRVPQRAP